MVLLGDNSGACYREIYEKVRDAGLINAEWFARTYQLTPEVVQIINSPRPGVRERTWNQ